MFGKKTWHQHHFEMLSFGQKLADKVASEMGSWSFIIYQSILVLAWVAFNLIGSNYQWDPYPFILLSVLFSAQAAYAAPVIMMSQNRQSERDRVQATADYETNLSAKKEIENLQLHLSTIEMEKLDKIIRLLEEIKALQIKTT